MRHCAWPSIFSALVAACAASGGASEDNALAANSNNNNRAGASPCAIITAKEAVCGLDVAVPPETCEDTTAPAYRAIMQCQAHCYDAAGCDEIVSNYCGYGPGYTQATLTCLDACFSSFTCNDQSRVLAEWECDGEPDCADGSDEHAGCPLAVMCTGGDVSDAPGGGAPGHCAAMEASYDACGLGRVFREELCGEPDNLPRANCQRACVSAHLSCADLRAAYCEDALPADFAECFDACDLEGPTFICQNGQAFPADYECDGYEDCDDSSDEHGGCGPATFLCNDGTLLVSEDECDGYADCADGSDEHLDCPYYLVCE